MSLSQQFFDETKMYTQRVLELVLETYKGKVIGSEDVNIDILMKGLFEKPSKVKRKDCENNWAELVCAITILHPNITTKDDIINNWESIKKDKRLQVSDDNTLNNYYQDVIIRSDEEIKDYIDKCKNDPPVKQVSLKKVFLVGKSYKSFPVLVTLNGKRNVKKTKSDIYIQYENYEYIIGISVKASSGCTMTNYSVEKLLFELKKISKKDELKKVRIKILEKAVEEGNLSCKNYMKDERNKANALFYNKDNEYFKKIDGIINGSEEFAKHLLGYVFNELPYDCYLFNGTEYIDLNKVSKEIKNSKKNIERYLDKESPGAAKLWYKVMIDGIAKWQFCIRGKNHLSGGSMQVLEFTKINHNA